MTCEKQTEGANTSCKGNGGTGVQNPQPKPAWHRLSVRGLIDPFWMRRINGREIETQWVEPGVIEVEGVKLAFDTAEIDLPVGTPVLVRATNNFHFTPLAEHKQMQKAAQEQRRQQEKAYKARMNQCREESEAFNSRIHLPVAWVTAIKPVISGLTEKSVGDGAFSRTVVHIKLKENLSDGRLKREAGDFLCSTDRGRFADLANEEYWLDSDGRRHMPKVTCKQCLKIAERYMDK